MSRTNNDPYGEGSPDPAPTYLTESGLPTQVEKARVYLDELGATPIISATRIWTPLVSDHSLLGPSLRGYILTPLSIAVAVAESGGDFDEIIFNGEKYLSNVHHVDANESSEPWYRMVVELLGTIVLSKKITICISTNAGDLNSSLCKSYLWFTVCHALFSFVTDDPEEVGRSVANFTKVSPESHPDFDHVRMALSQPDSNYTFLESGSRVESAHLPSKGNGIFWMFIELKERAIPRYQRVVSKSGKIVEKLRSKGFEGIGSSESFGRHEIQIAMDALPRRLRPWGRYLLSESHLAQKYSAAISAADWQLLGGLLQLSGQTQEESGEFEMEGLRCVRNAFENMYPESICGVRYTDFGNSLLVLLSGISEPEAVDLVGIAFEGEMDYCPRITVLQY